MAFCNKCGGQIADHATFCPKCGVPVSASGPAPGNPAPAAGAAQGGIAVEPNVAGLLCYALGWVTGVIFLVIDKRPYVRFHAAQSIVVFGGLNIIYIIVGEMFGMGWMMGGYYSGTWEMAGLLFTALRIVGLILWILLMFKAYQGEKFKVPGAADLAESLAGK